MTRCALMLEESVTGLTRHAGSSLLLLSSVPVHRKPLYYSKKGQFLIASAHLGPWPLQSFSKWCLDVLFHCLFLTKPFLWWAQLWTMRILKDFFPHTSQSLLHLIFHSASFALKTLLVLLPSGWTAQPRDFCRAMHSVPGKDTVATATFMFLSQCPRAQCSCK